MKKTSEEIKAIYKESIMTRAIYPQDLADLTEFDKGSPLNEQLSMRLDALSEVLEEPGSDRLRFVLHEKKLMDSRHEVDTFNALKQQEYEDMTDAIEARESDPYEAVFKKIHKMYPAVTVFNKNKNDVTLDFMGKVEYAYRSDTRVVSEEAFITGHGPDIIKRMTDLNDIYKSMSETGVQFQRAISLGIGLDEAFNSTELQELFTKSQTEKELYTNIVSIRSEVELEWSFSETKTADEIETYRKGLQTNLKEAIQKGALYFVDGSGTEYQVDFKRNLIGETNQAGAAKTIAVDSITDYLTPKNVVACSAEAMEETKKSQSNSRTAGKTAETAIKKDPSSSRMSESRGI